MGKRVTAGKTYTFRAVGMDTWDPPYGVKADILTDGDQVRVVNLPGCPKSNVMGHAYIQTMAGAFAGLVLVNSLDRADVTR